MDDQLHSMTSFELQTAAFKILDAIQRLPSHQQVGGAALMFLLIMKRYNYGPRKAMHMAEQVYKDCLSEGRGEQIRAIENYLKHETI